VVVFIAVVNVATPMIVLSGSSMVPAMHHGDLVFLSRPHITETNVDDVIAFRDTSQTIVVHRIVEKGSDSTGQTYLVTKGDSNQWNDKEITDESNYVGKVAYVVPKAGGLINTLQSPLVLILISVTIAAYFMYQRSRNRESRAFVSA
jgi:signal peptidase